MTPRLLIVALVALICAGAIAVAATAGATSEHTDHRKPSYEVWLIDQEDRFNAGAGTLHVFDGERLARHAASAEPETIDLAGDLRSLCQQRTGTVPARPHMLVFNGGDAEGPGDNAYAIIAYVASGHVAFLDAATRAPVECIDVGTQAHAAWPTPDQRHLIVANQNGKLLQRIATDYENASFVLEGPATLDLASCTTTSGAPCQDPALRPDNAPICPRTESGGDFTFVTLRGGGMFVVDHNATPMRIVAEYDRAHIDDNGCGEMEARGKMYVNSGAGATVPPVPGDELWGHDVYAVDLGRLSATPSATPNTPPARLVYTRDGSGAELDAHAVTLTEHGRYLWWGDRSQNDVTVVDPRHDRVVSRFGLAGPISDDPAPDLFDVSPHGDYAFASLRGPNPSSGHEAFGSTPGVGVIEVRKDGRDGRLVGVARVGSLRGTPDPHAIRVRGLR
ncbi:MAG: hypothetical protein QOH58_2899 [Thermoleophilaceae bacterium]|jgi:hypothetical protein|nr:hypothetical protein [Thermoleophilaceae bacterium]